MQSVSKVVRSVRATPILSRGISTSTSLSQEVSSSVSTSSISSLKRNTIKPKGLLNILHQEEKEKLTHRRIDRFKPGDHVAIKIKSGGLDTPKLKLVAGVVISKRNKQLNTAFKVGELVDGTYVEHHFPLFSPWITEIINLKQGGLRRAQAYGLRDENQSVFKVNVDPEILKSVGRRVAAAREKITSKKKKQQAKKRRAAK